MLILDETRPLLTLEIWLLHATVNYIEVIVYTTILAKEFALS